MKKGIMPDDGKSHLRQYGFRLSEFFRAFTVLQALVNNANNFSLLSVRHKRSDGGEQTNPTPRQSHQGLLALKVGIPTGNWLMRTKLKLIGLCLVLMVNAAMPADIPSRVVERGPHHRVSERVTQQKLPNGTVVERTVRQVELAAGMHYQDGENWLETRELIEPHPDGAVAHYGQHKAAFSANLNSQGAIQLVDADGNRFTSHILGLAYTDAASGQSVLVATLKNCVGQILPPNQIVYTNAFAEFLADVRYTYTRNGFEQDIILRQRLPSSPEQHGMNPATTRLEVFTEFIESPFGFATREVLREETDPERRQQMVIPDFIDETMNFGALGIGKGRAIDFQGVVTNEIPVGKTWETREGRTFLIESVELPSVQTALNALPTVQVRADAGAPRGKATTPILKQAVIRPFPAAPKQRAAADRKPMRLMASLDIKKGVLLDYSTTLSGGFTNYTFLPEATYHVTGAVNLYGTSTIVGGTVVKFARESSNPYLSFNGTVVCDTAPYRPAIFTAVDDSTVGTTLTNKAITNYYAAAAMRASTTVTGELHDLRFKYANTAIDWNGSTQRFYNLQFINCSNAIARTSAGTNQVHNILATNVLNLFSGSATKINAQHVTANNVGALSRLTGSPATVTLTNSILVNVTNLGSGTISGDYLGTNGTPAITGVSHGVVASSPAFTTAAGGQHYLATNSTLRDAGTTNIATNLLAELRLSTVSPPLLLTNAITTDTVLSLFSLRDTNTPDLGYHFAPLDYIAAGCNISGATVLLTNGAAVGVDYGNTGVGFLFNGGTLLSIGSPTAMNQIVRAYCVQENSRGLGATMFHDNDGASGNSVARFRFTEFSSMSEDGATLWSGAYWSEWEWSHCYLYNLSFVVIADVGASTYGVTNNVFQWADATFYRFGSPTVVHLRNNLFRNHNLNLGDGDSSWTARDNLFDTQILTDNGAPVTRSHNAYYHITTNSWSSSGSDVLLSSLTYDVGPLSKYYQQAGSSLINAGSQNATNVGLYHFTTTTNQAKEADSQVDIGPHFVALNNAGQPIDSDGDGPADHVEDSNGNGIVDVGETPFAPVVVTLTAPANGAAYYATSTITLTATASILGSSITNVEFFDGTTKLGEDNTSPYSITWNNPPGGIRSLTARAMSAVGVSGTSSPPVSISVYDTLFVVGSTNLSASDTNALYRLWTNGFYPVLKKDSEAVSSDGDGKRLIVISASASSSSVGSKFTSNNVPVIAWEDFVFDDLLMTTTTAGDYGQTTGQSNLLVSVTNHPLAAGLTGTVTVVTSGGSFSWGKPNTNAVRVAALTGSNTNLAGVFGYESNALMIALDAPARRVGFFLGDTVTSTLNSNGWKLFDAAVQWATGTNAPPTDVAWIAPTNGSSYIASTNITLTAQAIDADSGMLKMGFYQNGVRIGTTFSSISNQYSLVWSNIPAGDHLLAAKAVDNGFLSTTQLLTISVKSNALFVVGLTNLNASESAIRSRLESNGFVVTVKAATNVTTADALGKTLVLISATAAASDITNRFTTVNTPVLLWQKDLFDDMGMVGTNATNFGTVAGHTDITLLTNHVMAAGLTGTATVFSNVTNVSWAIPGSNAIRIASVTNDSLKTVVFGYEKRRLMAGLGTNLFAAPGRRVGFMLTSNNAALLNGYGWSLFDEAVRWLIEKPCAPKIEVMLVQDVSGSLTAQDFKKAKSAGSNFVAFLSSSSDKAGVISFADVPRLEQGLTNDIGLVQSKIMALTNRVGTVIGTAISMAQSNLDSGSLEHRKIIILLSDGILTATEQTNALNAAATAKNKGTQIITLAYGTNATGQSLMQQLASSTADYYQTPDISDVSDVYAAIADAFCRFSNPPTVTITNPTSGMIFNAPTNVTLEATASDSDGFITQVQFFEGTNSVGVDTAAPYSVIWSNVPGIYTITAVALDNTGLSATSAAVVITINQVPVVNAGSDQILIWPANQVTLAGTATDDGRPTNATLVTTWSAVSGPGTVTFGNVNDTNTTATFGTNGIYVLRLTANDGAASVSSNLTVTIRRRPDISITSPFNGVVSNAPTDVRIDATASDLDGTVTNVAFYAGTTLLGTDTTAAYSILWTNPATNIYNLTAVATDNDGLSATSAPVVITINQVPVVNAGADQVLVWPVNQLTLAGTATDDGRPTNATLTTTWTRLSGPGSVTFSNANLSNTLVSFSTNGTNILRLTAADGAASVIDDVVVVVDLPPTVSITSPTNGTVFPASPTNITITASATDDGSVTNVEFYSGTNKIGQVTTNPYSIIWSNVSDGTYALTARAIDNWNVSATSTVVSITVQGAPQVSILSPTNNSNWALSPTNISITATASSPAHSISHVQFFAGTNTIGVSFGPVFNINWRPVFGGTNTLTARAVDETGRAGTSGPVIVNVNFAPVVTLTNPTDGAAFTIPFSNINLAATAYDTNGSVTNVEFFAGTNFLGSDASSPYMLNWSSVPPGTYHVYARATDDQGAQANSEAATITVQQTNSPPYVFAGSNQTIRLTNSAQLNGIVLDDGLPSGVLTSLWQKVSGVGTGTGNVTFTSITNPVTSATFTSTGTYVLRLTAGDGQFTTTSDVNAIVLPLNQAPIVNAGTNSLLVLAGPDRFVTNNLPAFYDVVGVNAPISIDYLVNSNALVATVNWDISTSTNDPNDFALLFSNGTNVPLSSLRMLNTNEGTFTEIHLASVRSGRYGFNIGDTFSGSGDPGSIVRITPSGQVDAPWLQLTNENRLRGGICIDDTGIFGGDLILATTSGRIWRINSNKQVSLVTNNLAVFHAVTTVPYDAERYGPLAGKIVAGVYHGQTGASLLYAIAPDGSVSTYNLGFSEVETIAIVPPFQYAFATLTSMDKVAGTSWENFLPYVGDIMVGEEDGEISVIRWNGLALTKIEVGSVSNLLEGMTFAPVEFGELPALPKIALRGSYSDDGLPGGTNNVLWFQVSGPAVTFLEAINKTNTTARIVEPGQYVFRFTGDDGELTNSADVTVHVIQNQAPFASAGNNLTSIVNRASLNGSVTDDGYPSNYLKAVWSVVSVPLGGEVSFDDTNAPQTQATFTKAGNYVLRLTGTDGQAKGVAEVLVNIQPPAVLTLSPSNTVQVFRRTLQTFQATLQTTGGVALVGSNVTFTVDGPNPFQFTTNTDAGGHAVLQLQRFEPTTDSIRVSTVKDGIEVVSRPTAVEWVRYPVLTCDLTVVSNIPYAGPNTNRYEINLATGTQIKLTLHWTNNSGGGVVRNIDGSPRPFDPDDGFSISSNGTYWVDIGVSPFSPADYGLKVDCSGPGDWYPDAPPSISIVAPTNHATFEQSPAQFAISASVYEPSGFTQVVFYANGSVIGTYEDDASPASVVVSNLSAGTYNLRAVVHGNQNFATSAVVTITVTNRPDLHLYSGGVELTNFVTVNLGITTVSTALVQSVTVSNLGTAPLHLLQLSNTGDFTVTLAPTSAVPVNGSATLTVQFNATTYGQGVGLLSIVSDDGDFGNGVRNPFVLNLAATANATGAPPTITLSAPTNGAVFTSPAAIALSATATSSIAPIAKVEFFSAGTFAGRIGRVEGNGGSYAMSWNNVTSGSYTIDAIATDVYGRSTRSASMSLTVISNNVPRATNDSYVVLVNTSQNLFNVLTNDFDLDGDSLRIVSVTATNSGTPVIVNDGRAIQYIPAHNTYGWDAFDYVVSDGRGGTARARVIVNILIPAAPQVALSIGPGSSPYAGGTLLTLTATPTFAQGIISRVEFYGGEHLIGLSTTAPYTNLWPAVVGVTKVAAVIYDTLEQSGVVTNTISVTLNPGDANPPIASFSNLTNQVTQIAGHSVTNQIAVVRDGLFVVQGSAYDPDNDATSYKLRLNRADGSLLRELTPQWITGAVTNGPLFTNDFTLLRNDVYQLELIVSAGGRETVTNVTFALESELKVGQFSFSQQDMVIPVAGLPLSVIRTYSTLNPNSGDFGNSWTYSIHDLEMSIDENRVLTEDVEDSGGEPQIFSLRIGGGHDVTLTLPDGRRTTFAFYLDPGPCNPGDDADFCAFAKWVAPPDVYYTLEAIGDNKVIALGKNLWWGADSGAGYENFDFPGFILTSRDGTQYRIDREDIGEHWFFGGAADGNAVHAYGQGRLTRITQRTGDTISIATGSIVHTNAAGQLTRSVTFQRTNGHIVSIVDPNSTTNVPAVKYEYDYYGNLVRVLKLTDRATAIYETNTYVYGNANFPSYITEIRDSRGITPLRTLYDNSGRMIGTVDAFGKTNSFDHGITQNLTNRSEVIWDRLGNYTTHYYDSNGNITVTRDALGQFTYRNYDAKNNMTEEVDALSHTNRYGYDSRGNRTAMTNALGQFTLMTYDASNQVLSVTDSRSNTTWNAYDTHGNLAFTTNSLNQLTTFLYDANSHLISQKDALGNITTNQYDALGNLTNTAVFDVANLKLTSTGYGYDNNGNRTSQTLTRSLTNGTPETLVTAWVYDAQNRVVQTIEPDGFTNKVVYNSIGQQQFTIDKLGRTNAFEYDDAGRLFRHTYPDGSSELSYYDFEGRRTNMVDRAGRSTLYLYDELGRMNQTVYADGATSTTAYDPAGRVAYTVDARGNTNAFGYDEAGRRTSVTNALNVPGVQTVTFSKYDETGNLTNVVDAAANSMVYEYDALNRRIKAIMPATVSGGARATNFTGFDAVGRRVAETNEAGVVTRFGYDGLGRMVAVTNAWGTSDANWATYAFDEAGNQTNQVDALGRVTKFQYDKLGRRTVRRLPSGDPETSGFDALGNLVAHTNFNGLVITNSYDVMNRLRVRGALNVGVLESYTYSVSGQLTNRVDESGSYAWVYDVRDRVRTNTTPVGALYYGYDLNGNLTNLYSSTSGGVATSYRYDALNRITNTIDNALAATTKYGFDVVGNLAAMQYPNGVTNAWQYDTRNRLTNEVWKLNTTSLASFFYKLSVTGQRTNLVEAFTNASPQTFAWSYDQQYRLTNEVAGGLGNLGYRYDVVGNRTNRASTVSGLGNQTPSYTTNDWLTTDTYDTNGNTTASGSISYKYDWANRLTNANNGAAVITYNAEGQRIKKVAGGTTTLYLVDTRNPSGYAQVLEELTVSGSTTNLAKVFTYGLDLISQRAPGVSTNYFGYDGHGSTRFLTDADGSIANVFVFDAYGTLIATNGVPQTDYLYCGEQFDRDLGLVFLRARYLNPTTGRFWTMDSFEGSSGDPLSLHKYLYAQGNSVNATDPSGRWTLSEVAVTVGIAIILSPDIANAPASGDPTFSSHGGVDMVANIVGGQIIGKVVGYGVGAVLKGYSKLATYVATKRGPVVSAKATVPKPAVPVTPEPGAPTGSDAASFENELFIRQKLDQDLIVYRAEGNTAQNFGRYYGTQKPLTALDAEELSNLSWGNPGNSCERVVTYHIPKGTVIYEGRVAGGSGRQIYLEGAQGKGVQLISSEPLSFSTVDPNFIPGSFLH